MAPSLHLLMSVRTHTPLLLSEALHMDLYSQMEVCFCKGKNLNDQLVEW